MSGGTALVFGGGGVKAAAHAGAWRAVTESGLVPSQYVGTSMGAVMAAAFAAGLTAPQVSERMTGLGVMDVARPRRMGAIRGLLAPSLFLIEPLRLVIEHLVPARRFDELKVPLIVTAVHLDTGEQRLFGPGQRDAPLVDVLLASCALPFFYPPVMIEGERYADGGLREVLPLTPLMHEDPAVESVVAVDTGPGFDEPVSSARVPPLVAAHNSATGILMAANTRATVALWRATPGLPRLIYVRPRVERHVTFQVDLAPKYAEEGYRATREALNQKP